jgi:pimeloyl-ACP methyl ester carboxylesterase
MTDPIPGKAKSLSLLSSQRLLAEGVNDVYTQDGQYVCIHLPAAATKCPKPMPLLVVVHGYSARRNNAKGRQAVRRFATLWGNQVAEMNWAVMAPHFDEVRFQKDYQRLNRLGLRADLRLNQLVAAAGALISNVEVKKCFLLGFSGGGQFVHRYAAFHGNRFSRIVVGAPGWFMWPDPCLPYPLGMGEPDSPGKGVERLRRLCRRNMLLLVGEKDHTQGALRKRYHGVDLCALQGEGRRERALNWFSELQQAAAKENIQLRCQLRILEHTAHRINQRFIRTAVACLAGSDPDI